MKQTNDVYYINGPRASVNHRHDVPQTEEMYCNVDTSTQEQVHQRGRIN